MTRSAVRICPAAPRNGLSHWDRPFFRISEYSNCRLPARSADSIIYGCFPPAGNIRQFESAQQLQRTVYPIGIGRSFVFLSIRTADLPREARIQSSTDVFLLRETSGRFESAQQLTKNGLSHRDRPFFRISEYSNCRPPARSADSIIYGCFPPAGNIRQFESAQQLQRTVYPIGIDRSFVFLSIRTADLPREARIQSSTDVFRLRETSGSSNLPSSSKNRFTASR